MSRITLFVAWALPPLRQKASSTDLQKKKKKKKKKEKKKKKKKKKKRNDRLCKQLDPVL